MSTNLKIIKLENNSLTSSNGHSTKIDSGNNLDSKSFVDSNTGGDLSNGDNMLSALGVLYKKYSSDLDQITTTAKTDLKRDFDDYVNAVEKNFAVKVNHSQCKNLKIKFAKFDERVSEIERNHGGQTEAEKEQQLFDNARKKLRSKPGYEKNYGSWEKFFIREDLKFDFFYFYTILVKVWLGEPIKKSEIELIQPCKVLITRSLIKRKFDEEIDMRLTNENPKNDKAASQRAAFQNQF